MQGAQAKQEMVKIEVDDDTYELLNKIKAVMERSTPVNQTYDNVIYRAARFYCEDHGLV